MKARLIAFRSILIKRTLGRETNLDKAGLLCIIRLCSAIIATRATLPKHPHGCSPGGISSACAIRQENARLQSSGEQPRRVSAHRQSRPAWSQNGERPLAWPISAPFNRSRQTYQGKPPGTDKPMSRIVRNPHLGPRLFPERTTETIDAPRPDSPATNVTVLSCTTPLCGYPVSVDTGSPLEECQSNAFTYPWSMKVSAHTINVENLNNSRILCITQTVIHNWFTRFPQGVVEKKPNALVDQNFTSSRFF